MTDPLHLTHTHISTYTRIHSEEYTSFIGPCITTIYRFFFLFSNNDCSVRFDGKEEHRNFKATP